jgi:CRP-like cAMP-binding protein
VQFHYGIARSSFSLNGVPKVQLDPSAFLADPELIEAFEKRSIPVACDENRVLFKQGDPPVGIYILSKGAATVSMDSGHEGIEFSCEATSGSLLGLPALIANRPYSLSAVARKGAALGFVPAEVCHELMQTDPAIMVKILQVLAAEVRSARLAIIQQS